MKPILVSIIIPCYNVENYVAECLDSAINQTYRPIEIIAVDNNSRDGTLAILKNYEKKYPDLITVLEKKKQGAPAARNKGMSVAKGEWLQFLDADDLLLPEKINKQIKLIEECNEKDYLVQIIGSYYLKRLDGASVKITSKKTGNLFEDIAFSGLGQTSANLFKRSAVIEIGTWDEGLNNAQDLDLEFKLLLLGNEAETIYDLKYTTIYRMRKSGQITSSDTATLHKYTIEVRYRHYTFLQRQRPELFSQYKSLFQDMLYYPIYCLGIYNIDLANKYRLEYLEKNYLPNYRPNIISRHHVLGVKLFGFTAYMRMRQVVKSILSFLWLKNIYSDYRFKNLRMKDFKFSKQ